VRRIGLLAAAVAAAAVAVPVLAGAREHATARRAAGPPTYYGQVGSILQQHCAGCHTEGGVAPFALDSVTAARRYARAVAAVARAGTMPPWPPGRDSQPFVGQAARLLSAAERETLAAWATAGAPSGRAQTLPHAPAAAKPAPGARVLRLRPPRAYTPSTRGGFDDYHCFLLDPRLARDTFLTGALIRPSATSLVHHVILFEAAGAQAAAAVRLDAASGGRGWTCFGGPGLPSDPAGGGAGSLRFGAPQWLAAWVPGHVTNTLPAGTGIVLHSGAKIVMQVHYNLLHGSRPDRSEAVLTMAPPGTKLTPLDTMLLAAPVELPCPKGSTGALCTRSAALADLGEKYGAGASLLPTGLLFLCGKTLAQARGAVTSCDRPISQRLTVYGVAGHMHLRGREISLVLDPGTPSERTLLHIPRWDFRWQDAYFLKRPVALVPGDTLRLTCRFDTSTDTRYVLWGEGTTDEMCLGLLSVAAG
jgi:mono/diheme cytochrome c family protein